MPHTNDFFLRLLELPLFQGLGKNEFLEMVERVQFVSRKCPAGTTIVKQDEPCRGLIFVLSGDVCVSGSGDNHSYILNEQLHAPQVVQPENLFGLNTTYTRSFLAETEVEVMEIDKSVVRDILFDYTIFRFNYLNFLSYHLQQVHRSRWRSMPQDLPHRFVRFLADRCCRPAGQKELRIKMTQLAKELDATRLNVSRMLGNLEQQGKIQLYRERIVVPAFQDLLRMR